MGILQPGVNIQFPQLPNGVLSVSGNTETLVTPDATADTVDRAAHHAAPVVTASLRKRWQSYQRQ